MGSKKLKVLWGKLKFPISALQCGIVHKALTLGLFRFSFTSHKDFVLVRLMIIIKVRHEVANLIVNLSYCR